jgi:hypothetical protein
MLLRLLRLWMIWWVWPHQKARVVVGILCRRAKPVNRWYWNGKSLGDCTVGTKGVPASRC